MVKRILCTLFVRCYTKTVVVGVQNGENKILPPPSLPHRRRYSLLFLFILYFFFAIIVSRTPYKESHTQQINNSIAGIMTCEIAWKSHRAYA